MGLVCVATFLQMVIFVWEKDPHLHQEGLVILVNRKVLFS